MLLAVFHAAGGRVWIIYASGEGNLHRFPGNRNRFRCAQYLLCLQIRNIQMRGVLPMQIDAIGLRIAGRAVKAHRCLTRRRCPLWQDKYVIDKSRRCTGIDFNYHRIRLAIRRGDARNLNAGNAIIATAAQREERCQRKRTHYLRSSRSSPPWAKFSGFMSSMLIQMAASATPSVSLTARVTALTIARFCSTVRPSTIFTLITGIKHLTYREEKRIITGDYRYNIAAFNSQPRCIMEKRALLYTGKSKAIYATDDPELVIIHYNDDATAGNGAKHEIIEGKGILNNRIATLIFRALIAAGIPTHYRDTLNDREQLCEKVEIIPLEVIVRNVIAGSMATRLGFEEGSETEYPIFEICYKKDDLGDPLINDDHAVALGIASYEDLDRIYELTDQINATLFDIFDECDVLLVDFKIEFGRTADGEIVLADEISPDSCRLWDADTLEKLDKDRFRRDMGGLLEAYQDILERLEEREENDA